MLKYVVGLPCFCAERSGNERNHKQYKYKNCVGLILFSHIVFLTQLEMIIKGGQSYSNFVTVELHQQI
jgi:hypothetical protein